MPTIGDRLSDKGLSWAWYSGGWNDAIAGNPDPLFQFHHQPFAFFQNYADGTPGEGAAPEGRAGLPHVAQTTGTLPAVSFIKPIGEDNEHPGYASLVQGQQHVADIVSAVQSSPYWKDTAIIVTYDENGGRWDHVAPPKGDRWGPGSRVPTIIISPFAKRGFVDHTQYDTTSILKLIETRWGLAPLGARDAAANDLTNAFSFSAQSVPATPSAPRRPERAKHGDALRPGLLHPPPGRRITDRHGKSMHRNAPQSRRVAAYARLLSVYRSERPLRESPGVRPRPTR